MRDNHNERIKRNFDLPQKVILKINGAYKAVGDVLAINCNIPSQSNFEKGLVYIKLSVGFITIEGKLEKIEYAEEENYER